MTDILFLTNIVNKLAVSICNLHIMCTSPDKNDKKIMLWSLKPFMKEPYFIPESKGCNLFSNHCCNYLCRVFSSSRIAHVCIGCK